MDKTYHSGRHFKQHRREFKNWLFCIRLTWKKRRMHYKWSIRFIELTSGSTVPPLVKKFTAFTRKPKPHSPFSQQPTACLYRALYKYTVHALPSYFVHINFNIILPLRLVLPSCSCPSAFTAKLFHINTVSPNCYPKDFWTGTRPQGARWQCGTSYCIES